MIFYVVLVNAIGLVAMWLDKYFAKKNMYRISEKTLFLIGILGGAVGEIVGMYKFRHKTKHTTFTVGLPIIVGMQMVIGIIYYI